MGARKLWGGEFTRLGQAWYFEGQASGALHRKARGATGECGQRNEGKQGSGLLHWGGEGYAVGTLLDSCLNLEWTVFAVLHLDLWISPGALVWKHRCA
jgi:hypothetical protein